jgi:Zn-finger nucleic acid-binding protein
VSGEQFYRLAVLVAAEGQVESSAKLTFQPRKALKPHPDNPARVCPQCSLAMREFNYAYDSNVFLDRCGQCNGIWLDPNEIIDIAAHIQYNPDVDAVGRAMIKEKYADEDETKWICILAGAALAILRVLIFKH